MKGGKKEERETWSHCPWSLCPFCSFDTVRVREAGVAWGATGGLGLVLVPKGIWGSISMGFWGVNASGAAWLPFSKKSTEVWENRRETKISEPERCCNNY